MEIREENRDEGQIQTEKETKIKKERGIPRWVIFAVLGIILVVIVSKIYVNNKNPISQKAY